MGYIQCKHCGAQMSDKSEACPVCGTPVDGAMPPEPPTEQNNEQLQNKPFNKLLVLGVVGGIVLVGIIVAIVLFAKSTGINSSIYKPLKESVVNKQYEKNSEVIGSLDYQDFYAMTQQLSEVSKGEQDKYKKISYKRLYNYLNDYYSDYYVGISDDADHLQLDESSRGVFQIEVEKHAIDKFNKQYREAIIPQLNGKKQEWENYIENHRPENYLIITPQYGYKTEGAFFIDYRPKFYFDVQEPKGRLSEASVVFYVVDKDGNDFIEPQQISLSELKYYDSDENYKYFSKVDDDSFWNNHSIKIEINSISQGRTKITKDDINKIPEVVKNYLGNPNLSNESQFVRQYVKADYPVYEYFVEDFVMEQIKQKDPLCFELLQTYSGNIYATTENVQNYCIGLIKNYYSKYPVGYIYHTQNKYYYQTRRFIDFSESNNIDYLNTYIKNTEPNLDVNVVPYSAVKNTYRVEYGGKYTDGYIVLSYENGRWRMDNVIIKTAQKPNNENKLAIDYSKHIQQAKSAIQETPNADEEKEKSLTKDDKDCIAVLQKYYTASDSQLKKYGGKEAFETKRFIKYTSCWDSQVLTSNQDFGIGDDCLKVHSIEPNPNLVNSYIVSVSCGESEAIPTCVIMKKDGGKWKIDNIAYEPYSNAYIDYSKSASAYYAYEGCGEENSTTNFE